MKLEDYQFFQQNGYLSLGKILTDEELAFYLHLYDQDRKGKKQFWFDYGHHHQTANYDVLVSTPEFDGLIRHPNVIKPLSDLMGGDVCFSEIGIRHMEAYTGESRHCVWHRDGDEAGTAIVFNFSVLHTATVRTTNSERKTVQVYYGHRNQPHMANDSLIPVGFWKNHPDEEVRNFYGVLNDKTRKYLETGGDDEKSLDQAAQILYNIDYKNRQKQSLAPDA